MPHDHDRPPGPDGAATLHGLLDAAAAHAGSRTALTFDGSDLTYADLARRSRDAAAEFGRDGPPLLLAEHNSPQLAARLFGAYRTGRPVCAVDPALPAETLAETRADLGDEPVVQDADDPSSIAVLQYTSGTTGGRKAAMMSHRNLVANAHQNNAWFRWTCDDVVLGALPLFHTWGLGAVLHAAVAARARIALLAHPDADVVVRTIERERVSVAYGSATLFHRLLDAAGAAAPRAFRSLRYVKAGAMLVGGTLPARWSAAVPDVPMVLGYGLTEASPEVCNNPLGPPPAPHGSADRLLDVPRAGTVGRALPGTELRICAPDAPDTPLPTGHDGEIQVRGPQVMRGYWRRDDATRAALLQGGWLRTGDLGRLDGDGFLTVLDRLKDLIKFRGWSVIPAAVERVLLTCPGVAEAIVVGVPHDVDGEVPVACVVPHPGTPLDPDAVREHCRGHLVPHEIPRRVVLLDSVPKNAVGKPLRRVLRDRLR